MGGKVNVILSDREARACETFRRGLEAGSGEKWEVWACVSNKGRSRGYNVVRYFKYVFFPLLAYWKRGSYGTIFAWQQFYAVGFCFWARLLGGKVENRVVGKNLIYRAKKGLAGRIYLKWLKYATGSDVREEYTVSSEAYRDMVAAETGVGRERLKYVPFGKEDFTQTSEAEAERTENRDWEAGSYALALGRSNRDYDWMVESLAGTGRRVHIISDEYRPKGALPENVRVSGNLSGLAVLPYLRDAATMILPLKDGTMDSGETVLLMGYMFSKPVVVTGPSCLAEDYVDDGRTGLVIPKTGEALRTALERLDREEGLAARLGAAARETYERKYSEADYGRRVGRWLAETRREQE